MTWTKLPELVDRDLRTELIKKSTGVVRNVIMMAHPRASDDDLINMIREDFSDAPMMNEAREELLHMRQKPEEQMRVYVYRYGRMHQRSSGIRAADETHQHIIQDFIKSLKPKLKINLLINLQKADSSPDH